LGGTILGQFMIKKILLSIDLSETTDLALDFGFDLAIKYSNEILIVCVPTTFPKSIVYSEMLLTPRVQSSIWNGFKHFVKKILSNSLQKKKKLDH
jgi:hypothetical protein